MTTAPLVPPRPQASPGQRALNAAGLVGLTVAFLLTARLFSFLLAPLLLAVLAYYLLNPLVNLAEDRGMGRRPAATLVFTLATGVLLAVMAAGLPWILAWVRQLPADGSPSVFEDQLAHRLTDWEARARALYPHVDWQGLSAPLRGLLESGRRHLMEQLPAMLLEAASHAGPYILAPVIAFFLLLDGPLLNRTVMSWVPNRHFETALLLVHRVDQKIAGYLRGTALDALAVFLLCTLVLLVVGMPGAALFGCLFAVLNVIPLVGPLLGAGAGIVFALVQPEAPSLAVLAAAYLLVHAIDVLALQPLVVGKSIDLHPVTIIAGLIVGGSLAGVLGMLLVIPVIAVVKAVVLTLIEAREQGALG